MDISDSDDDIYEYESYALEFYEELDGPPLIKKRARLIAAVVQNQVEALKDLLDSPKWYNVTDKWGYSLLQIAILRDNVEVFDYMMSIPDFPLEFENKYKQTALVIALEGFVSNDIWMQEHFSYELIKKGACVDKVCFEGNTLLHCALDRSHHETAKLLIQKGVDVNICNNEGETPLDLASFKHPDQVVMLLLAGAQPLIKHFEMAVLHCNVDAATQIFLILFDEFLHPEIRLDLIVKAAEIDSWLFYEMIKLFVCPSLDICNKSELLKSLCKVSIKELKVILEKFSSSLIEIFSHPVYLEPLWHKLSLDNLSTILHSNVGPTFINFVSNLDISEICECLCSEELVTERYCFFLSYNLRVTEYDLVKIYERYGYCELFKILLHMDIGKNIWRHPPNVFPLLVYNIKMEVGDFLRKRKHYSEKSIDELVNYFAHPQLVQLHCERAEKKLTEKKENLPRIPLLVEIARNEFRKYFVRRFNLKTCRDFYTYLNCLPISDYHKKIISYEIKLY